MADSETDSSKSNSPRSSSVRTLMIRNGVTLPTNVYMKPPYG